MTTTTETPTKAEILLAEIDANVDEMYSGEKAFSDFSYRQRELWARAARVGVAHEIAVLLGERLKMRVGVGS